MSKISAYIFPGMSLLIPLSYDQCLDVVSKEFNVNENQLKSKGRKTRCVLGRYIMYYVLRHELRWTFKKIGETFNRDHSSVMHSLKANANIESVDSEFKERIDRILSNIYTKRIKHYRADN